MKFNIVSIRTHSQVKYHLEDDITPWYHQSLQNTAIYYDEIQNIINGVQAGKMQYGFPKQSHDKVYIY